jgi:hypothetical protein
VLPERRSTGGDRLLKYIIIDNGTIRPVKNVIR